MATPIITCSKDDRRILLSRKLFTRYYLGLLFIRGISSQLPKKETR